MEEQTQQLTQLRQELNTALARGGREEAAERKLTTLQAELQAPLPPPRLALSPSA